MLFAPSAKHAPAALQEQLTSLQRQHDAKVNTSVVVVAVQPHSQSSSLNNNHDEPKADRSARKASKSEEIVEAMKKLDAKLVAYLAGEDLPTNEKSVTLGRLSNALPIGHLVDEIMQEQQFCEKRLEAFKCITAMKLQMEALTLQAEGTKRMELLQSEVRPIFTVECQLSNDLIKNVTRYDMFHIMQFESEKFQSLTQCTRFGQEAQREIHLPLDNNDIQSKPNFGRIHFTVWWREPGTCLNEMLGMGLLDLEELYNAALLEQCKRIAINRRGIHLANLYLKISLQQQQKQNQNQLANGYAVCKEYLSQELPDNNHQINQCSADDGNGDTKGNPSYNTQQKQSDEKLASHSEMASSAAQKAAANSGEYAESFLYLKDTTIQ